MKRVFIVLLCITHWVGIKAQSVPTDSAAWINHAVPIFKLTYPLSSKDSNLYRLFWHSMVAHRHFRSPEKIKQCITDSVFESSALTPIYLNGVMPKLQGNTPSTADELRSSLADIDRMALVCTYAGSRMRALWGASVAVFYAQQEADADRFPHIPHSMEKGKIGNIVTNSGNYHVSSADSDLYRLFWYSLVANTHFRSPEKIKQCIDQNVVTPSGKVVILLRKGAEPPQTITVEQLRSMQIDDFTSLPIISSSTGTLVQDVWGADVCFYFEVVQE